MTKSLRKAAQKANEMESFENSSAAADSGVEGLIDRFSGKSEAELMRELKQATSAQKAEGRFDELQLKQGIQAIAPMLNAEQRRRLDDIIKQL